MPSQHYSPHKGVQLKKTYKSADLTWTAAGNVLYSQELDATGMRALTLSVDSTKAANVNIIDVEATAELGVDSKTITDQATATGSYAVTAVSGDINSDITISKYGGVTTDVYTVLCTTAGAAGTQGSSQADNTITSPLTQTGNLLFAVDTVAKTVALTSGMTSSQVIDAINAIIGDVAVASLVTNHINIKSYSVGTGSTVVYNASTANALAAELGFETSGTPNVTEAAGTAATGKYSVTSAKSGSLGTNLNAGQTYRGLIPGLNLTVGNLTGDSGESAKITTTGQVLTYNASYKGKALGKIKIKIDGGSEVPSVSKALVRQQFVY